MIGILQKLCSLFLLSVVVTLSSAGSSLYDDIPDIIQVTGDDIDTIVKSESIWMIQLYDPAQNESKDIVDPYTALGILMRGLFKIAVLDVTQSDSTDLAKQLSIKSITKTPSFYIIGDDKKKPVKVKGKNNGIPDVQALAEGIMNHASLTVSERSKHIQLPPPGSRGGNKRTNDKPEDSRIVQLTASNFNEKVYGTNDVVAVAFTAPGCEFITRMGRSRH